MTRGPAVLGLRRSNLAARSLITLHRGAARNPDVVLVETDCGQAIVKDYAPRDPWVRKWLGPRLIAREARAYRQLADHPGVPRLLGVLDPLALVLEHRGGPRFSKRRPWTFSPEYGRQLEVAVRGLHERGVVHLDLRHRSNLRAGFDGRPVLIDLGSALCFRVGGLGHRVILPMFAWLDRWAVRKWRRRLEPGVYSEEEGASSDAGDSVGAASDSGRGASRPM